MLKTVEAEIRPNGTVTLLEPLQVKGTTRAIVTLLENDDGAKKGNGAAMLELLRNPEFKNRQSYSAEEIEAQIEEARNPGNKQDLS